MVKPTRTPPQSNCGNNCGDDPDRPKQLLVIVPASLHRRVKIAAAMKGRTMHSVIVALLNGAVDSFDETGELPEVCNGGEKKPVAKAKSKPKAKKKPAAKPAAKKAA